MCLALAGCDSQKVVDECVAGARECAEGGARMCEAASDGHLVWSAPVDCGAEQLCRTGACVDPSASQQQRADALSDFVSQMAAVTAYPYAYDPAAITSAGRRKIFEAEDSDGAYLAAMWWAFDQLPQGHQGMSIGARCGRDLPYQGSSRFGVCGRPYKDGIAITTARKDNRLALATGDRVVRAGTATGHALFDEAWLRPVCGGSFPSASGRRTQAAASFFGTIPAGTELEIVGLDGTRRTVTVPLEGDGRSIDCTDPLGRSRATNVEVSVLADGTAVVRVPSFIPFDEPFPTTNALSDIDAYRSRFQAKLLAAFESVKGAPRIVWDVRGNGGGLTLVGLEIASGFPGATAGELTTCSQRIEGSIPPTFDLFEYATYSLTPGGAFGYVGKVAVLIDGLNYSAADYFAYFARHATSALLVGSGTAGAYGATSDAFTIDSSSPTITFSYDSNRCVSLPDRTPLEGRAVAPTVEVEYEPADLAAGRDTVLLAAVSALSR